MTEIAGPAVLLRRRPYGDTDLILTLLTRDFGKRTLMARSARRSVRRFAGCLDPFSLLRIAAGPGKGGLDGLREASLDDAFPALRRDIRRVAVAGFWTETADLWLEPAASRPALFDLFRVALTHLDAGRIPTARVHLIFQLRFLDLAGLAPDLFRCRDCGRPVDAGAAWPDIPAGGFRCGRCSPSADREPPLPAGVLPLLRRAARKPDVRSADPADKADGTAREDREAPPGPRAGFPAADAPAAELLERFVSHHLGRTPRSLAFLRDLRNATVPVPFPERRASHAGSSA